MIKSELVAEMAKGAGIPNAQAERALASGLNAIAGALKKGEKVSLTGFGTWSVMRRGARSGRNPQTGEKIRIKAKTVAKFAPGKQLTDAAARARVAK